MTNAMTTFEENVKRKITEIVAELIPQDRWESIVRQTIQNFEKEELPKLIKKELEARYTQQLKDLLNSQEFHNSWQPFTASEGMKKLVIESAPAILANMIAGVAQDIIRNTLHSGRTFGI